MDKLDEIMEWKRKEIAPKIRPVSDRELTQLGERLQGKTSFYDALAKPDELSIVAEIKRKSPSAGTISENASAVDQARIYQNAGADAMSADSCSAATPVLRCETWRNSKSCSGRKKGAMALSLISKCGYGFDLSAN